MNETSSRRQFLCAAGATAASAATIRAAYTPTQTVPVPVATIPPKQNYVDLPQIHGDTESAEHAPGPFLFPDGRLGFAIIGLGRLSLNQILPGSASSSYCKPVALVSGDREKAIKVGAQYGIPESHITGYAGYEKLPLMPGVDAVYIVLPNSMHREFVIRGQRSASTYCAKSRWRRVPQTAWQ